MIRALFLDFDGVVMPAPLQRAHPWREGMDWSDLVRLASLRLDPACVARVEAVCRRTDAEVVLSTSWRALGLHHLRASLLAAGLSTVVRGKTGREREELGARTRAIGEWVGYRPTVRAWAALDDDAELMHGADPSRVVLCNPETGITDEDADRAARALMRDGR